ncbi:MAG: alpha-2-macroglobulin family protein, partial [Verrucomicrobiia bacterium]
TTSLASLDGESRDGEGVLRIHALKQPDKVHRPSLMGAGWYHSQADRRTAQDRSDPEQWESGEVLQEFPFRTEEGVARVEARLAAGLYRASVEVPSKAGPSVTAHTLVRVIDPKAKTFGVPIPYQLVAPSWQLQPGETFTAAWGTGYHEGRAYVEVIQDQKVLKSFWTDETATQQIIELPIVEEMRGGVSLRLTFVRENRAVLESRIISVPWSNKELKLRWERFTSKLQPGASETWTAVIEGPDAEAAAAEMVATLYDASLDQFLPHQWIASFPVFRDEKGPGVGFFHNTTQPLSNAFSRFTFTTDHPIITRTQFHPDDTMKGWLGRRATFRTRGGGGPGDVMTSAFGFSGSGMEESLAQPMAAPVVAMAADDAGFGSGAKEHEHDASSTTRLDPSTVVPRRNLEETAFFFPSLMTDEEGRVSLAFQVPEALTTWRFMGFAHDSNLRAGLLESSVVTAREMMVQPNPPRFLREGDVVEFTVKISNRSEQVQSGEARLTFMDVESNTTADAKLGLSAGVQAFEVPGNSSRTLSWRIQVPDGCGFLTYRATATTGDLSDGEEGWLPVLSRRIMVTESLPLPIRGPAERAFTFQKLLDSDGANALESRSLVVQMTSNPAWYAVMALPYLMEFPHQCNEQVFHRFYANLLARHIARSDPKIEAIFAKWRDTDALESPLSKNEDIKGIALEETPWLRHANNETEARRNVGLLFGSARVDREIARAFGQLEQAQYPDGTWPWFPAGQGNDFITLTIVTGFGRLHHLGIPVRLDPAIRALGRLDDWIVERYRELRRTNPLWEEHIPTPDEALYLYARSFFLGHRPIPAGSREALDFYLGQGRNFWLKTQSRMTQGHLALALHRFGDKETPKAILSSLRERAVTDVELGMYWKDAKASWWWHRAPIETHALLIEAFDEIADDKATVEELRVWLLKQKQTQDWKTTKATADAVYALLLRGSDLLANDQMVEVSLGGTIITPPADDRGIEAGTGAFERRFAREAIRPDMGNVQVVKRDEGIAWGAVHWQYLSDL